MDTLEFFRVLDNLYDAVWLLDRDRRITHWNEGAQKLTGYSADEMVGVDCREKKLVHLSKDGVDLCDSICPLLDTDTLRDIREAQVYIRHKEGHLVPAQARMVCLLVRASPCGSCFYYRHVRRKRQAIGEVGRTIASNGNQCGAVMKNGLTP